MLSDRSCKEVSSLCSGSDTTLRVKDAAILDIRQLHSGLIHIAREIYSWFGEDNLHRRQAKCHNPVLRHFFQVKMGKQSPHQSLPPPLNQLSGLQYWS